MRTYIIAEAGVNHNGSPRLAEEMVIAAARAGADAIKFQTFRAEQLSIKAAPKAEYQKRLTDTVESQYDMLKRLELPASSYDMLIRTARENEIDFISSPFDTESVKLLIERHKLKRLKIPSGEITNAPLLLCIARMNVTVIVSTGMCSLREIETALGVLAFGYLRSQQKPGIDAFSDAYASRDGQLALRQKVTLLHCTTEYPAPYDEVDLNCMDTMRQAFQLPVGYSDHTQGIAIPLAAAARGACMIEKHFTLDRSMEGPDHQASLEPDELQSMVTGIRQIEQAFSGDGIKYTSKAEAKNKSVVRKSLTASKDIKAGKVFSPEYLTLKRPGGGIEPIYYWDWLGKVAKRDYRADEQIE